MAQPSVYNTRTMRTAAAEAWVLARILPRASLPRASSPGKESGGSSRGGAWYLLAIPLFLLAAFFVVTTAAILWVWGRELRSVGGHSGTLAPPRLLSPERRSTLIVGCVSPTESDAGGNQPSGGRSIPRRATAKAKPSARNSCAWGAARSPAFSIGTARSTRRACSRIACPRGSCLAIGENGTLKGRTSPKPTRRESAPPLLCWSGP